MDDALESDFNTLCEDESTDEIGNILVNMWRECGDGNFERVHQIISRERLRSTDVIKQSQGLESGDMIDSDDENEGGELEAEIGARDESIIPFEFSSASSSIADVAMMVESSEAPELVEAPVADPDGWETVTKPKKTNKSGKKKT